MSNTCFVLDRWHFGRLCLRTVKVGGKAGCREWQVFEVDERQLHQTPRHLRSQHADSINTILQKLRWV